MSAAFPDTLRTSGAAIVVAPGTDPRVTIRVQLLEAWDAVRLDIPANASVASAKMAALEALAPTSAGESDVVVKHRGIELRDLSQGLADAGIPDHATLSIEFRRRRPVR